MFNYRTFRNTDPPRLVELWNALSLGRGAVILRNSTILERYVFSKPFFDPNGLFLAEENGRLIGYAHAGGCQAADGSEVQGVVSAIGVLPSHRRRGVGTHLLYQCEEFLQQRGVKRFFAGEHGSLNPFYTGLYGGSDAPGFLKSDTAAEPFLRRHRYQVRDVFLVMQRKLVEPLKSPDPRFPALRQQFNILMGSPRRLGGWWEEGAIGSLEPIEFLVVDKAKGVVAGRALVWEMEAFSSRWGKPSLGILSFQIGDGYRAKGLGKLLFTHVVRQAQEQFFELLELHISEKNLVALSLLRNFGFETVDRGQVFLKQVTAAS